MPSLPSPDPTRRGRRAIGCMLGAMACFVVNDALSKFVSQGLPAGQLIFLRGLMATLLVLAVAVVLGEHRRLGALRHPRVLLRAGVDACATVMYLLSLFRLPLGNATAINLAAPLFMTVFAAIFLRERPGAARWWAVGIGFVGVLLVVQPRGDGFNAWALLCLAATLFHATRDLLTRGLDPAIPSIVVTLSTALAVTLLSGALSVAEGWQPATAGQLGLLALSSAFLATAYFLLIQCMRQGEVSLTAPFRYSALLFAVGLGYAVWGDVPNAWAWAGIALLVGSGLQVIRSERNRQPVRTLEAQAE
ncbi:MAG: DMT family transporter [Gammaproteobacteria bacterium]|uniref:DMT family transporter n=1 Tax=unclassified Pseudacidovorax TaxID=2620592 RepID=UPI001B5A5B9F|nr:DMT family transporter [Pseudacidovorax sp.]MBP6895162.1 DMT family transporter [Pseudacidovorax sp.]